MAVNVHGDDSLLFKTGVDTSGLRRGTQEAKGILGNLKQWIIRLGIFAGITMALRKAKREVYDFAEALEHSLTEVATISDEITENFDHFRKQLIQMSTRVPDDAKQLSDALYQIVSAGYDGAEGMELLDTAAKTATAGMTDTKVAADLMTSAMNAWQMETDKAEDVADALFTTVRRGKTTIDDMARKFGEIASVAAPVGVGLEEVLGSVQTLTKIGMPVSETMQRIRAAIRDFAREFGTEWTKTMTLQEKAIEVYEEAGGKFENVLEVMTDEGAQFVNVIGNNMEAARGDLNSFADDAGAMNEAFGKAIESSTNKSKLLGDRIRATLLPLGNQLVETWNKVAGALSKVFETAEDNIDQISATRQALKTEIETVESLLSKYEDLSAKQELSNEGRKELNRITNEIADILPDAVTAWNKEGEAVDINRAKIKQYLWQQREVVDFKRKEQVQAQREVIQNLKEERDKYLENLRMREDEWAYTEESLREKQLEWQQKVINLNQQIGEHERDLNQILQEESIPARELLLNTTKEQTEVEEEQTKAEEDRGEAIEKTIEKMESLSKMNRRYQGQVGDVLKSIKTHIQALNNVSSDYNTAEQKRIRKQIDMWKELFTAIDEARRVGYGDWVQQRAERALREMTGPGGLMPMRPAEGDQPKQQQSKLFKNLMDNTNSLNDMFYQLSDTASNLNTELGDVIEQLGTAMKSITGISDSIGMAQEGGKIGSLKGFMGVASPWMQGFQVLTTVGPKIQNILHDMNSTFQNSASGWEFMLREQSGILRDSHLNDIERNKLLEKIEASGKKTSNTTLRMLRELRDSDDEPERVRRTEGEETTEPEQSLRGAVRGITEQTAGLIAGRLHGIHMHVVQSTQIVSQQLSVLKNIQYNTFYNKRIYDYITEGESDVRSLGGYQSNPQPETEL
ncbi:MAG: phage tail tape measure protein [bacterium]